MKFFIVLSAVAALALGHPGYHSSLASGGHYLSGPAVHGYHGPAAPLAHDGRVIDTPEVAHAKAAHFAAHADAAAHAHYAAPHGDYEQGPSSYGAHEYAAPLASYHGPPAPLGHDGRVVDTPEVAHAKAAHLVTLAEEAAKAVHAPHSGYYGAPHHQWTLVSILASLASVAVGSPQWYGAPHGGYAGSAVPAPLGPDGRVVDTPEVAQLKAAHLSALAEANARAPKGLIGGPSGPYAGPDGGYAAANYVAHYSGPPAPLGPDGRVIDTPEVQQAKAVHFSLYNAQAQRVPAGPAEPATPDAWNAGNGVWNGGWNGAHEQY
ncbi:cuticle protein 18.7 [Neodiprion pinetum]|nr:pupal cuticle protein-like [Neodiprion pinetum]